MHRKRFTYHDPAMGTMLLIIGIVMMLTALLVPYCGVIGIPAVGITAFAIMFFIPERGKNGR